MRLESLDGNFVELDATGYQFADIQPTNSGVDWDANWLMIHGKAWDGTRSWEFVDPCMTTWEARELASWLRDLSHASSAAFAAIDPDRLTLWLTEPNVTFVINDVSGGITILDIYFNAESHPPTGSTDDEQGLGHAVRLIVPQVSVAAATEHWERSLRRFPVRKLEI